MAISRHIAADVVRDIAKALVVLALVFLSYAHHPIGVSPALEQDVLATAVTADFCGNAAEDGEAHAPCHACRIGGGADVPPPPCAGVIHLRRVIEAAFAELAATPYVVAPPDIPEARGPPALA